MGEQEEEYTRLALILDKDMNIVNREINAAGGAPNTGDKIYIRKNVKMPEQGRLGGVVEFNADKLNDILSVPDGDKNILTVYLDKDLKVHKSTVTSYIDSYFDDNLDFEVNFNGNDMYYMISTGVATPGGNIDLYELDDGGMKLNKKPKKKTKNGTYKKQVNKTK